MSTYILVYEFEGREVEVEMSAQNDGQALCEGRLKAKRLQAQYPEATNFHTRLAKPIAA